MSQTVVWECTAPENEIKSCVVVVICVTVWSPSSATSPEVDRAGATHPGARGLGPLRANPTPVERVPWNGPDAEFNCGCNSYVKVGRANLRKKELHEISGQTISRHAHPRPDCAKYVA